MNDFFTASPAERRLTLLTFRDNDSHDAWQSAALTVANSVWGWGWWLDAADLWSLYAAEVRSFAYRRRHAWVPPGFKTAVGPVAAWIDYQRAAYAAQALTADQFAELEGISNWEWDPAAAWALNLAAFDQFTAREGHGFVPRTHREGASGLGAWVMAVRNAIAKKELPTSYLKDIEERGAWEDKQRVGFEFTLTVLQRFADREGHARVPVNHVEELVNLGQWTNSQRNQYVAQTLTEDRISALEAVEGWVWQVNHRRSPEEMAAARAEAALNAPASEGMAFWMQLPQTTPGAEQDAAGGDQAENAQDEGIALF
jgi:hypothetical protein